MNNYLLAHNNKRYLIEKSRSAGYMPFKKRKIYDYLYQLDYDFLDYDYALKYFKHSQHPEGGACSVARVGDLVGRNLDWTYNNQVDFVIHRSRSCGNYASIGIAGNFPELTKATVESGITGDIYKVLPFRLQDGVNELGLFAEYNVVKTDYGENTVIPTSTQEVELPSAMLVRFILDKFSDATTAANYIKEHCKIYFTQSLRNEHFEHHVFLCDSTKSYVLEFIENQTHIIDVTDNYPYMTNFYRYGTVLNSDGTVYTPETQDSTHNAVDTNHVTEFGAGLERWNIMVNNAPTVTDVSSMQALMRSLFYTNAYRNNTNIWYTEFTGTYNDVDFTVKTSVTSYAPVISAAKQLFETRSRDTGLTWQTTHSAVYNIVSKSVTITSQENTEQTITLQNENQYLRSEKYILRK